MKIEVPHAQESEQLIKDVFGRYTEVNSRPSQTTKRTIVHIYPRTDTIIDGEDDLTGYRDSYNCEMHFYFTENMTVYKTAGHNDGLNIEVPCEVRIFKDLSTMIIIDEPIKIGSGQNIYLYKVR